MNDDIVKLLIAFFVGLIPFILKIIFDSRSYQKSQIDKYGAILFEKQLELFQELNSLIADYQNNISTIIISGSFGRDVSNSMYTFFKDFKDPSAFDLYQEQKKHIEDLIDRNTILIPDFFLTIIHDYIQYSEVLYNTWLKGVFKNMQEEHTFNNSLSIINNKDELIEFNDNLLQKHFKLSGILKMIVGTENLKKHSFKYTFNKNDIPKNVQRIKKANI